MPAPPPLAPLAGLPRVLHALALALAHSYTTWGMLKDAWAANCSVRKLLLRRREQCAVS